MIISGPGCYSYFRNESGMHCLQRVPPTERSGRRQTSYISVAVLPIFQQTQFKIDPNDVEMTAQTGGGNGGMNQNKVASAIRATHKPSGITVFVRSRDQIRNRSTALRLLEAKISNLVKDEEHQDWAEFKRKQLGSSGRGGTKIRTLNFIESRATDHRTGKKVQIDKVMKGGFDLLM